MFAYCARAVPWPMMVVSAALTMLLMAAVRIDAWTLWPLVGVAVGLVAAATAWCLDEPAAAAVDVCPRGLGWRTAARLPGVLIPVAAWVGGVWFAAPELFGHAAIVLVQGIAAALVAAAWVSRRRAAGEASPGQRWALVSVPAVTAWALVRPFERHFPVFPYATGDAFGDWGASLALWAGAGAAAMLALAFTLRR